MQKRVATVFLHKRGNGAYVSLRLDCIPCLGRMDPTDHEDEQRGATLPLVATSASPHVGCFGGRAHTTNHQRTPLVPHSPGLQPPTAAGSSSGSSNSNSANGSSAEPLPKSTTAAAPERAAAPAADDDSGVAPSARATNVNVHGTVQGRFLHCPRHRIGPRRPVGTVGGRVGLSPSLSHDSRLRSRPDLTLHRSRNESMIRH